MTKFFLLSNEKDCHYTRQRGSKRIPRKNIKNFLGKPIIAYSIAAALQSGLFDEVMVSTDDEEIADVSKRYGAHVPFYRSAATADDFATTVSVLAEVLNNYLKLGETFDYGCCLYPTAPLINTAKLKEAFDLLIDKNYDTVFPVLKFSYPIWRSLKLADGKIQLNWPEYLNCRSQDLTPAYHDAGQFYLFNIKSFRQNKVLFSNNSGAIELAETEVQDIDTLLDWQLAELKYQLAHSPI